MEDGNWKLETAGAERAEKTREGGNQFAAAPVIFKPQNETVEDYYELRETYG